MIGGMWAGLVRMAVPNGAAQGCPTSAGKPATPAETKHWLGRSMHGVGRAARQPPCQAGQCQGTFGDGGTQNALTPPPRVLNFFNSIVRASEHFVADSHTRPSQISEAFFCAVLVSCWTRRSWGSTHSQPPIIVPGGGGRKSAPGRAGVGGGKLAEVDEREYKHQHSQGTQREGYDVNRSLDCQTQGPDGVLDRYENSFGLSPTPQIQIGVGTG